jgi:Family of unknown function (DUF6600)/FecR protein
MRSVRNPGGGIMKNSITALRAPLIALGVLLLAGSIAYAQHDGYTYLRVSEGGVSVVSQVNGRVDGRINLPIATGDEISTGAGARAELVLADGNVLQVDGESRVRFDALAGESGSNVNESVAYLEEGSLAVESIQAGEDRAIRIDTDDASVYLPDLATVRVNFDARRGTVVMVRQGRAEVQTRAGSYNVAADHYLVVQGDEQPEIAGGAFSRDRFDIWVADRIGYEQGASQSASSRYVNNDNYDNDVGALDNYGAWDYSTAYDTYVWHPSVSAGWSPYCNGYWYWTPIGVTWVSYEPWGWFPFHYGSWFFDAGFGWCWSPAFVYSPAWVYWAYAPGYIGWCPIGYYAYYSPYYSTYYRSWGFPSYGRGGLYVAVNGVFPTARVSFRAGWNFVGANRFGAPFARTAVLSGAAVAPRLGRDVAISSDPVVVNPRAAGGTVRVALQDYLRDAPVRVARAAESSGIRAETLAPFLARQRTLPRATASAIAQGVARTDRSAPRLVGPAAERLDPVAAARTRGTLTPQGPITAPRAAASSERAPWRSTGAERTFEAGAPGRGAAVGRESGARTTPALPDRGAGSWRSRAAEPRSTPPPRGAESARPSPAPRGSSERARPAPAPRNEARQGGNASSWRERPAASPAQRVIDGIERGRQAPARSSPPPETPRPTQERHFESWRALPGNTSPRRGSAVAPSAERTPMPRGDFRERISSPRPQVPITREAPSRPAPQQFRAAPAPRIEAPRASPSPTRQASPRSAPSSSRSSGGSRHRN